jgi:hypothetical protein
MAEEQTQKIEPPHVDDDERTATAATTIRRSTMILIYSIDQGHTAKTTTTTVMLPAMRNNALWGGRFGLRSVRHQRPGRPPAAPPLAREGGGPGGSRALFLLPDPMETCRRTHWKEGAGSFAGRWMPAERPARHVACRFSFARPTDRTLAEPTKKGGAHGPVQRARAVLACLLNALPAGRARIASNRIGGRQERLLPTAEGGLGSRSCWRMEAASTGEPSRRDYYCLYK